MSENTYCKLVNKQREFFNTGSTLSPEYRVEALKKLKNTLIRYKEKAEIALHDDLGRSSYESYLGEIGEVLIEVDIHIDNLRKWARPKREKTPLFLRPAYSRVMYEPYGVSLIISPWNYPFSLAILPLIAAISAGNTAIIKPSEFTPETSSLLSELLRKTFDEKYVAVVEGGVTETTELLKEKFDFIFFTGSTKVGRIVSKAAAENLTPLVLELGGKSPVIIDDSVPMKVTARRIAMGKVMNCGQVCVAPDYVFIKKHRKDEFASAFLAALREFFEDKDLESSSTYKDMVHIISERHFKRLENLLSGENIIWGGKAFEDVRKFQPALVDCGDVKDYVYHKNEKTAILKEEIFGPLLPIITYEDIDDVIKYIGSGGKPLAMYIFSNDKQTRRKLLRRVSFGGGCINDTMTHVANNYIPFGGVGESGHGNYHGKHSFMAFSHQKSLVYSSLLFDIPVRYLPSTDKKLKFLKRIYK